MKEFKNEFAIETLKQKDWFHETMILSFEYQEDEDCFTWQGVTSNFELPRGQREFVLIRFQDVISYERYLTNQDGNEVLKSQVLFRSRFTVGTHESESSKLKELKDGWYSLVILLPYRFGEIKFVFKSLVFKKRIGFAKLIGENEWEYYDIDSNEKFDFYFPFG